MDPHEPHLCQPALRTLTFTLTRADALAYETLPREITGWRRILLFVWIGLAGAAVAQLPADWVGEEGGWRFWAFMLTGSLIQYALATLAMSVQAHWRAVRRLPRPSHVEVLDHVDHFEWREGGNTIFVAPETMSAVATTPTHTFVEADRHLLILPLRAFSDKNEMVAFTGELERRCGAI